MTLSALVSTACSQDPIAKEVEAMMGKEINLDFTDAYSRYDGKDSVFSETGGMKMVAFIDSLSCSNCFMNNLYGYQEINDSLIKHGGSLIVIFHPRKSRIDEVIHRLEIDKFPFWCIADTSGNFIERNECISSNSLLHTFSLDANNKVILVGDPTKNSKIYQLFLEILNKS